MAGLRQAKRELACIAAMLLSACVFAGCFSLLEAPTAYAGDGSTASEEKSSSGASASDEETPLEKAMRLIIALPSDPDAVTEADRAAIDAATDAYNALGKSDRDIVDSTLCPGTDHTYDRLLESAQWGLEAQQPVDNTVAILDGDYSAYVSSSSTRGKSSSKRDRSWSVVKFVVEDERGIATVRCNTESSFTNMRVGGVDYPTTSTDGVPQFEVPLFVNGTTTFTVDANSVSSSIAYRITLSLPLQVASADEVDAARTQASSASSSAKSKYVAADAQAVEEAALRLSIAAEKSDVTVIELDNATKALNEAVASATPLPKSGSSRSNASSKSSGSSSKSSTSSASTSSKSGTSSTTGASSGPASASRVSGTPQSQAVPAVKSSSASSSSASAAKTTDSKKSDADERAQTVAATGTLPAAQSGASTEQIAPDSVPTSGPAFSWSSLVAAGLMAMLLIGGMCAQTLLFIRAKDAA